MFETYTDLLTPGLRKIAKELELSYREFSISDETTERMRSCDDFVYADIKSTYISALQRGLRNVEI